jgi:hypothetical protein
MISLHRMLIALTASRRTHAFTTITYIPAQHMQYRAERTNIQQKRLESKASVPPTLPAGLLTRWMPTPKASECRASPPWTEG